MIETSNTTGPAMTITGNRIGPKTWDECTETERIERLKEEVRGWRNLYSNLLARITAMETHQHGPNGTIVVPYSGHMGGGLQGAGSTWDTLR